MGESKLLNLNSIKEKIFSKKGSMILLIIGFAGIALILISDLLPSSASKTTSSTGGTGITTTSAYAKQLESELTGIVGRIDGVGRIHVMVTVESGVQYVYEQNQKSTDDTSVTSQNDGSTQKQTNTDSEANPVIVQNNSGGQQALIKTELQPTIMGVVIVCDGGDSPVVQENITNTVMSALNVSADHISVCKLSKK
jgi:stage III sporulation protein AG